MTSVQVTRLLLALSAALTALAYLALVTGGDASTLFIAAVLALCAALLAAPRKPRTRHRYRQHRQRRERQLARMDRR